MSGVASGWAWVEHLEDGGTTPWSDFLASAPSAPVRTAPLPGAAQLELARRINLVTPGRPHPAVTRILAAGAPGRGPQDLPLVGATPPSAFGPPPVDPAAVPLTELVRVASGVLAEDLASRPVPDARDPQPPVPEVRGPLGPNIAGRRHRILRLPIASLDALLYDEWVARAARGRVRSWPAWTKHLASADRLPETVDLVARAADWDRAWWRRVELVGTPPAATIDAHAVAVVRRVNTLLGLLVDDRCRARLAAEVIVPWLGRQHGPRLAVPAAQADWVRARAERMAGQLADAGYRVREDFSVLAELDDTAACATSTDEVLAVTVGLLRDGWEQR